MTEKRRIYSAMTKWFVILALVLAACSSPTSTTSTDAPDQEAAAQAVDDTADAASAPSPVGADSAPFEQLTTPPEPAPGPVGPITELNVAYFFEWPLPAQIGQDDNTFAEAVGVDRINWIPFVSSGEMSDAMNSGDIDISFSQGATSFANSINEGAEFSVVGIAVDYSPADICVVRPGLEFTRDNAAETLENATVMTSLGNISHYKLLRTMQHLGVDVQSLDIVEAQGGDPTAASLAIGEIDVGCAFGTPTLRMLENGGSVLMSAEEQAAELGIHSYDIISITTTFGEQHGEIVTNFLKANDEFNTQWRTDPTTHNATIARAAGMEDVGNFLAGENWFSLLTVEEQLSSDWLGGNIALVMQQQIELLAELGAGPPAVGDFLGAIDTSFLEDLR